MNTEAMLRLTLERGGGTFRQDGTPLDHTTKGFAVGIGRNATQYVPLDNPETLPIAFEGAVGAALRQAAIQDTLHIGTWLNEGIIEVDPVVIIEKEAAALAIGRFYKQKAIYSFEKADIIEVSA